MATTARSFLELSRQLEGAVQESITEFVNEAWDNIVLNPIHPYDTGTLQASWKAMPYIGGGQDNAGDTFKPNIATQSGAYPRRTDKPDFARYRRTWNSWIIFNNQPYTMIVNDLSGKPYTNWIYKGFRRAQLNFLSSNY